MFIVAKTKGPQHGLKGQCVLVPTHLKKFKPFYQGHVMKSSLALKRRLTDKSVVNKQQICPALANTALQK